MGPAHDLAGARLSGNVQPALAARAILYDAVPRMERIPLSYFGPFRETTKVCKELPDIHIPSMLRRVFLTGHESNERAIYQAVYDMDLCIHQGVLEYPVREEEYRDQ